MSTFDFASQLMQQDPYFIEQVMEILHKMQKEQPEKFLAVRFKIGTKIEREQWATQNFGSYKGPDDLTCRLLDTNAHIWASDPQAFWKNPTNPFWGTSATGELFAVYMNARSGDSWSRLAQRMACIVLELMYRELGRPPLSIFASAIQIDMVGGAPVAVEKHVGDMLSHGSRYLNIEANLGHGICFVLGCDLPETHWYKLLPKKDAAFHQVMDLLRSAGVEHSSAIYGPIRDKIVESRMESLRAPMHHLVALRAPRKRNAP